MSDLTHDIVAEGAKAAPAVAAITTIAAGVDLNFWIQILSLTFIGLQIGWLLWKYLDKLRGKPVKD